MSLARDVSRSLWRVARERAAHGPRHDEWSFVHEVAADVMREGARASTAADFPGLRAFVDRQAPPAPSTLRFRLIPEVVGGVSTVRFRPRLGATKRTILFLHGGGYVFGSLKTHGELCATTAIAARASAVFVDYRLAPEHPFPAAYDDAFATYRALLADGTDPRDVVVAGDSAGGALAVGLATRLRDAGLPQPAGLVLICPWVDPLRSHGSRADNGDFDWLPGGDVPRFVAAYAGRTPVDDPRISILGADLRGLPPTLLQFGSAELMTDEARDLAAALKAAGVHVESDEVPAMIHDFQLLAAFLPEARAAIRRLGEFARAVAP